MTDILVLSGGLCPSRALYTLGNIIIEAPTNIYYGIQCEGMACNHEYVEGYLIPWEFGSYLRSQIRVLREQFNECKTLGCDRGDIIPHTLEEAHHKADKTDEFFKSIDDLSLNLNNYYSANIKLQVDRDKVLRIKEGFIPVIVTIKNNDFYSSDIEKLKNSKVEKLVTLKGYVTFGNCD